MSLCCFPLFRGSGQKKAQAERCFSCCRNRRKRHHRYPSPSGRRHPKVTEASSGQVHPGQAPAGVTPREHHTFYPSSRVCVCVCVCVCVSVSGMVRDSMREGLTCCAGAGWSVSEAWRVCHMSAGFGDLLPACKMVHVGVFCVFKGSSTTIPAWRCLQMPLSASSGEQSG